MDMVRKPLLPGINKITFTEYFDILAIGVDEDVLYLYATAGQVRNINTRTFYLLKGDGIDTIPEGVLGYFIGSHMVMGRMWLLFEIN